MKQNVFRALVTALIFIFTGCTKPDKQWDVNALVPIAHGDLTIADMLKDSSVRINPDKSLTLVNVQTLKALDISSILRVPDTSFGKTVSLQTINLGTRVITKNITLGEVAKNAGLTGLIIVSNNGKKIIVPPVSGLATGQTDVDAQSLFTTATFVSGTLELSIHNGFPIPISDMHFQLLNKNNPIPPVIDDTIVNIPSNGTHTKSYPLAGKTVNGILTVNILSMSSPGSNGDSVLVDTTNALSIKITGSDMHVFSATAIFPAQNLVDDKLDVRYNLFGPEFKKLIVRTGVVRFNAKSTIKDSMYLTYAIPGAVRNGQSLGIKLTIPPSDGKNATSINDSFKLDGSTIDLTGSNHDTTNTYFNSLQVHIDSTGKLESLALNDSVYLFYGLFNVVPEYASGFLGTKTFEIGPESVSFDFLKKISVNNITIPEMKVNLQISNGVGATANGIIKSITGFNSKTGKSVVLSSSTWINKPIIIPAATDVPSLQPAVVNIPLDNTNSNITSLLEILPDQIFYNLEFTLNPNGNTSNYNDFIYYESKITASLNIEMPLQVGFEGLVLQDTISPGLGTALSTSRIQDGALHINVVNDYPVEAKVQLYIMDKSNNIIDSFINVSSNIIPAGNGDPLNSIPGKGVVNVTISENQWANIKAGDKLILKSTLRTANSKVVKFYSTSHLKATITGSFRYRITTK